MRGEDWERQMLIKANYLCGSKSLFEKFYNYATKFIYPGSFTISPIEQIRKLKVSIEKRIKSDENIKLVAGGLRNIEFSIQALQLLNGGKDSTIRTGNSLTTIDVLNAKYFNQ
jgi:glutamate-ammonia-ligase adenylyltransferase